MDLHQMILDGCAQLGLDPANLTAPDAVRAAQLDPEHGWRLSLGTDGSISVNIAAHSTAQSRLEVA